MSVLERIWFDESLPAEEVGIHAFTKELPRDSATAEPG